MISTTLAVRFLAPGMVFTIPENRIITGARPPGYYLWGGR